MSPDDLIFNIRVDVIEYSIDAFIDQAVICIDGFQYKATINRMRREYLAISRAGTPNRFMSRSSLL